MRPFCVFSDHLMINLPTYHLKVRPSVTAEDGWSGWSGVAARQAASTDTLVTRCCKFDMAHEGTAEFLTFKSGVLM